MQSAYFFVSVLSHVATRYYCMSFTATAPKPNIMGYCEYDSSSGLITHNISWHVAPVFENISYKIYSDYWIVTGGCTYPNGTIAAEVKIDCGIQLIILS